MTDHRTEASPEQRVRDLHRRVAFVPAEVFWRASKKPVDVCEHCTDMLIEADTEGGYAGAIYQEWPCPTIQALEGDESRSTTAPPKATDSTAPSANSAAPTAPPPQPPRPAHQTFDSINDATSTTWASREGSTWIDRM